MMPSMPERHEQRPMLTCLEFLFLEPRPFLHFPCRHFLQPENPTEPSCSSPLYHLSSEPAFVLSSPTTSLASVLMTWRAVGRWRPLDMPRVRPNAGKKLGRLARLALLRRQSQTPAWPMANWHSELKNSSGRNAHPPWLPTAVPKVETGGTADILTRVPRLETTQ